MKRIFLFSAFLLLNAMMVSCTADDVADTMSNPAISAEDGGPGGSGGTIPPTPPTNPKPPGGGIGG